MSGHSLQSSVKAGVPDFVYSHNDRFGHADASHLMVTVTELAATPSRETNNVYVPAVIPAGRTMFS
jgi:type 1 glutamine amidotransferase